MGTMYAEEAIALIKRGGGNEYLGYHCCSSKYSGQCGLTDASVTAPVPMKGSGRMHRSVITDTIELSF